MQLSSCRRIRALVIGGGPAGSACAMRLRHHGVEVEIAEQQVFPRPKVCGCCLGGAGLSSLDALGLRTWVEARGQPLIAWSGAFDGKQFELPLHQGVALSRETLDCGLLQGAVRSGAVVHQPVRARVTDQSPTAVAVRLEQETVSESERYDVVVIASGLNASGIDHDRREDWLAWTDPPHGPFGISFIVPHDCIWDHGELPAGTVQMACDDDGYVGMVRLNGGNVDIAAALQPRRCGRAGRPIERVWKILERSGLPSPKPVVPSRMLTTGPLRRSRVAGAGRLLAIGDAAGYVEPFTGEGITWGIETGIAAADHIVEMQSCLGRAGDCWAKKIVQLTRVRRRRCRWITSGLRNARLRDVAASTLSRFPQLAVPFIDQLNRGINIRPQSGALAGPIHEQA